MSSAEFDSLKRKFAAAVLVAIALFCSPARLLHGQAAKAGSAAPEFRLKDLSGKEVRSSQLKGMVVVLDVWATWCEPCIEGIPMFNRLHDKYAGRGLQVVGIAVQSGSAQDIKSHVAKLGIKYRVLIGNEKTVQNYVDVGFPITYLIGPDGKIRKKYIGSLPETETAKEVDLDHEINALLVAR